MIGKTISHYKILEQIGSGGMGVVYKAQDLKLDRFVALKFLPPHLTNSEEEKKRFIQEAKAASALEHNNICAIYEIDETDDGQMFICMANYEGETLKQKIELQPLKVDDALAIAIQIASGLSKAHSKKIVHRDVKPANVMITNDSVVKILDFGLAKMSAQSKLTQEATTLGTVAYMSPEQSQGEKVDHRTDIWSLGVILFEMLTGKLPFKGDYESATIYSIMNDTQEPVTSVRTGIPMELERIINKCLQKDPADRYQSADELIVDLRVLKRDSDSGVSTVNVIPPKQKKKIPIIPLVIGASILLIAIIALSVNFSAKEDNVGWNNSIGVLPFEDISQQKDNEHICDGMTIDLIGKLTRIQNLKVIDWNSAKRYKKTEKDIREIGSELEVATVLTGSIQKENDMIKVNAHLTNVEDRSQIWAKSYTQQFENILDLQDEISKVIAEALEVKFTPQAIEAIEANRPGNIEAYDYYLRGYVYHEKFFIYSDNDFFNTSEEYLKKAVALDTSYADAYAALADLYNTYFNYRAKTEEDKKKNLELQEYYLNKALDLNPDLPSVQTTNFYVLVAKGEIDKSYNAMKYAIKRHPNHAEVNLINGIFFDYRGLHYLAIKYYTKTLELSPFHFIAIQVRGSSYYSIGDYAKALKAFTRCLDINPDYKLGLRMSYRCLINLGNFNDADKILTRLGKIDSTNINFGKAYLYAAKGEKEKALKIYKGKSARIFSLLGKNDEAIKNLNEHFKSAIKNKESFYLFLETLPAYDNIRSDPRFQELLAKHKALHDENMRKYGDIEN